MKSIWQRTDIIGVIVGVIGIMVGAYFYYKSNRERNISIMSTKNRAVLVDAHRPSDLQVSFKGQTVTEGSVFVARIVVWNSGDAPVRREHILSPLKVIVPSTSRILTATISKQSRSIVQPVVKISDSDATTADLDWFILEPSDGFCIDLVVHGEPKLQLGLEGFVEGVDRITWYYDPRDPQDAASNKRIDTGWSIPVAVITAFAGMASLFLAWNDCKEVVSQKRSRKELLLAAFFPVMAAIIMFGVCWGACAYFLHAISGPPPVLL